MWNFLSVVSKRAASLRSLFSIETDLRTVEEGAEGSLKFVVRVGKSTRVVKPTNFEGDSASKPVVDPFIPYDENLFLGEISDRHFFCLNKFNVIDNHTLILTKHFEPQTSHLNSSDLDVAWHVLACAGGDGLVFYNRGANSGASQPHKHIQMTPLTNQTDGSFMFPFVEIINEACEIDGDSDRVLTVPSFPFPHAVCPIPQCLFEEASKSVPSVPFDSAKFAPFLDSSRPTPVASALHGIYERALDHMGLSKDRDLLPVLNEQEPRLNVLSADTFQPISALVDGQEPSRTAKHMSLSPLVNSYNFLMTKRWMFVVPRATEFAAGVSINSMGFVGSLFAKTPQDFADMQAFGLTNILNAVSTTSGK